MRVRVLPCASTRAKGCTRTKSWGLGIRGAHVERLTWRFAAASALRSCSGSVSLSLSHTHTDMHARTALPPGPSSCSRAHTPSAPPSLLTKHRSAPLHELIPPALWPQPGLLTRETDRERELERGGGGRDGWGRRRGRHTHIHTFTTTHACAHIHHHHTHTYVHSQHREKALVSGAEGMLEIPLRDRQGHARET